MVECTLSRVVRIFSLSRPGGGLFGRPITRESLGRFLFGGVFFRTVNFAAGVRPCGNSILRDIFSSSEAPALNPGHCLLSVSVGRSLLFTIQSIALA